MFPFYVFVICRANLVEKQKTHPRPGLWVGGSDVRLSKLQRFDRRVHPLTLVG